MPKAKTIGIINQNRKKERIKRKKKGKRKNKMIDGERKKVERGKKRKKLRKKDLEKQKRERKQKKTKNLRTIEQIEKKLWTRNQIFKINFDAKIRKK